MRTRPSIVIVGMGTFIEHYHRTVPFDAVLGGAEDVSFISNVTRNTFN